MWWAVIIISFIIGLFIVPTTFFCERALYKSYLPELDKEYIELNLSRLKALYTIAPEKYKLIKDRFGNRERFYYIKEVATYQPYAVVYNGTHIFDIPAFCSSEEDFHWYHDKRIPIKLTYPALKYILRIKDAEDKERARIAALKKAEADRIAEQKRLEKCAALTEEFIKSVKEDIAKAEEEAQRQLKEVAEQTAEIKKRLEEERYGKNH